MIGAEDPPLVVNKGVEVGSAAVAKPDMAVVHLVLDEHIGLKGIPDSAPGGPELREQLRKFYLEHGFRIMAGAYSESLHTVNANSARRSASDRKLRGRSAGSGWNDPRRESVFRRSSSGWDSRSSSPRRTGWIIAATLRSPHA